MTARWKCLNCGQIATAEGADNTSPCPPGGHVWERITGDLGLAGPLPAAPAGPVTSADAQGAIKPDVRGLNRPLRRGRMK